MQQNSIIVVQRALTALSAGNAEALAAQLHADVVFESPHRTVAGREQVARGATGERYEHLTAEIVPGRIVDNGDHVLADQLTILRWRNASEPVDISRHSLAIHLRDGLIYRLTLIDTEVLDTRSPAANPGGGAITNRTQKSSPEPKDRAEPWSLDIEHTNET
jgi:ketosteroid isomerase-like protein